MMCSREAPILGFEFTVSGQEGNRCLEIDLAGGHRLRVIGAYEAEALAGLIRRLST